MKGDVLFMSVEQWALLEKNLDVIAEPVVVDESRISKNYAEFQLHLIRQICEKFAIPFEMTAVPFRPSGVRRDCR